MSKRKTKSFNPDVAELRKDLRTVGKVLIASFFAIVVYPGDERNLVLGWAFLVSGLVLYALGLHKFGDS